MTLKAMNSLKLVIFLNLVAINLCHIALKYPPARKYDLDFLDNFRTSGNCGMNPGEVTKLEVGSQLNVTWHLGYPHGGGYKIQLIRDGQISDLVPEEGWDNSGRYAQSHLVTLPTSPCPRCTLRLLRQATEWGQRYQFRSCSDIALVQGDEITDKCGPHGTETSGGGCQCTGMWTGPNCQYKSYCNTDDDCNGPKGQGSCVLVDESLFPEKMCLCSEGWYGDQCQNRNQFQGEERQWTEAEFQKMTLGDHTVMWRVQNNEVEVIAEFNSLSWVGLGWRPREAEKSCQKFPSDAPAPRGTDFHAMDCIDMVIGVAKGEQGSVADYYTRDRSTPRRDSFWGGTDDITGGSVWETADGKTVMRFTKKIGDDPGDHLFQGDLHFIWATGQQDQFYKEHQLKYHGRGQRGIAVLKAPLPETGSLHPVFIGIIISLSLLAVLYLIQIIVNIKKGVFSIGTKK